MSGTHVRAPIVTTYEGGLRFAVQIRSHRLIVDQPARAGGEDAGPMPLELLSASLGSCIALYAQQYLKSRGLPYEGIRVEVDPRGATNPARIAEFVVRLVVPASLSGHESEMLERVARSCPAHHTLELGAPLTLHVQSPVPAGNAEEELA
jgi:uncharacterized OsmC-like protein